MILVYHLVVNGIHPLPQPGNNSRQAFYHTLYVEEKQHTDPPEPGIILYIAIEGQNSFIIALAVFTHRML